MKNERDLFCFTKSRTCTDRHYIIGGAHLVMHRSRHTEMCKTNKKKRPLRRKDGDSCRETVCKSNDALFLDLTQRNLLSYSLGSSHFSLSLWTTERNNVSPMHRANRFVWKIFKRIELIYITQKYFIHFVNGIS